MTDWTAFAGFSGVVVLLLLFLAHASQSMLSEATAGSDDPPAGSTRTAEDTATDAASADGTGRPPREGSPAGQANSGITSNAETRTPSEPVADPGPASDADTQPAARRTLEGPRVFGSGELLLNVLVTHGLFAALVVAAVVYWEVPASSLGLGPPMASAVGWGVAAGLLIAVGNEVGAAAATRLGIDHEETLRKLLAPESPAGWVILLVGVLPVVAVGEELIFRGVLVGALWTGFGLPVWGLAVASSILFALGHGAQGPGGIVVTGLLGFALAAAFVVSGSLVLVIVAHYVVNALEFVVHEGLGVEWPERA